MTLPLSRAVTVEATRRLLLGGRVQGIGMRPFIYRLARHYGLSGWVCNQQGSVEVLVQGDGGSIDAFVEALFSEAPSQAHIKLLEHATEASSVCKGFTIEPSTTTAGGGIDVPPDFAMCADCLSELHDPDNRRYRYPFINCTQCGPRYSLIQQLPYDRAATSMHSFTLCRQCHAEYHDPQSRRFHAEIIACPDCGPQLQFYQPGQTRVNGNKAALNASVELLSAGGIVAVKGIGGYHLLCDASNDDVIATLRADKPRPDKPLVVICPRQGRDDLECVRRIAKINQQQALRLRDTAAPIVLVEPRPENALSGLLAPGLTEIGVMLAYSPLHQLLLEDVGAPLVATSANVSGEPVMSESSEIEQGLAHMAIAYLHHDRAIEHRADDSVYRIVAGKPRPLRLGRGDAPIELKTPYYIDKPMLALGGHMKNTIALAVHDRVLVSPHIGELESPRGQAVFEETIKAMQRLYRIDAGLLVCDAHKGYASSRWAARAGMPMQSVWHHHAHAAALAGEYFNSVGEADWLVFTWDGVGLGQDGSLWGGEALLGRPGNWQRVASFHPFALPGGDKAARQPWRSAAALCWETGRTWQNPGQESELLHKAWQRRINCPQTTSAGRLFDAAAALLGLVSSASFEGQGPMWLEAAAMRYVHNKESDVIALPLSQDNAGVWRSDWSPLLPMLLDQSLSVGARAACFHRSLVMAIVEQASIVRESQGDCVIGLGGGVFQNNLLSQLAKHGLEQQGFKVFIPERLPCNDGGLSFGQIIEAAATVK